jgi:hypothetical protein
VERSYVITERGNVTRKRTKYTFSLGLSAEPSLQQHRQRPSGGSKFSFVVILELAPHWRCVCRSCTSKYRLGLHVRIWVRWIGAWPLEYTRIFVEMYVISLVGLVLHHLPHLPTHPNTHSKTASTSSISSGAANHFPGTLPTSSVLAASFWYFVERHFVRHPTVPFKLLTNQMTLFMGFLRRVCFIIGVWVFFWFRGLCVLVGDGVSGLLPGR